MVAAVLSFIPKISLFDLLLGIIGDAAGTIGDGSIGDACGPVRLRGIAVSACFKVYIPLKYGDVACPLSEYNPLLKGAFPDTETGGILVRCAAGSFFFGRSSEKAIV